MEKMKGINKEEVAGKPFEFNLPYEMQIKIPDVISLLEELKNEVRHGSEKDYDARKNMDRLGDVLWLDVIKEFELAKRALPKSRKEFMAVVDEAISDLEHALDERAKYL